MADAADATASEADSEPAAADSTGGAGRGSGGGDSASGAYDSPKDGRKAKMFYLDADRDFGRVSDLAVRDPKAEAGEQ